MIKTLEIKGFKSLLKASLELGTINVFIGPNGAGKSNLLEAVGLMGAAAWGMVDDESLLRRGVRPGVEKLYKSGFADVDIPQSINLCAKSDHSSYSTGLYIPAGLSESQWSYKTEQVTERGKKKCGYSPRSSERLPHSRGKAALERSRWKDDSEAASLLDTLAGYCIYSPNTQTLRNLVQDPQSREPVGLAGGRLAEAVQEIIQEKGEEHKRVVKDLFKMIGWASSFSVRKPGEVPLSRSVPTTGNLLAFKDRYLRRDQNLLSGYDASEGALYLLFTAVLVLHKKSPSFFSIDNADHGLNPRLARKLFEAICQWTLQSQHPHQMLLTTHNPLVLDGLPLQDERVRLFAVDRDDKGHTTIKRVQIDARLRKIAEDKGYPLSRLWVMGHLGGVPNV